VTHKSRDEKSFTKNSVSRNMMKPIVAQCKPEPSLGGTKVKSLKGLEMVVPAANMIGSLSTLNMKRAGVYYARFDYTKSVGQSTGFRGIIDRMLPRRHLPLKSS
jgi:hypothetical protein